MRKLIERAIIALLAATIVIAVIGFVFSIKPMSTISIIGLMFISVVYSGLQIDDHLKPDNSPKANKQTFINMVITVALTLAILSISIFTLAGKLF